MAEENQNRIFPTGKLVYALSWLALIGFILKIGRLNIFFAAQTAYFDYFFHSFVSVSKS